VLAVGNQLIKIKM